MRIEKRIERVFARFPEDARQLVGAPESASVTMIKPAFDRDPYGYSPCDDRDLYEVVWYE